MAAVAAQKIKSFASGVSERISETSTKGMGENNVASGLAANLGIVWESIVNLVKSPFFPYLFVTYILNLPPFAYGLASVFSVECNSDWLFFNAFLTAMHLIASVYTVHRIREESKNDSRTEEISDETPYMQAVDASTIQTPPIPGTPNSWERIRVVMCYDMSMAIYYVLCIVWAIWLVLGTKKIKDGEVDESCGRWVKLSVVFGFLYMGLGVVAWIGSLCFLRYNKLSHSSKAVLAVDENGGISLA